jgi:hypothetical protein
MTPFLIGEAERDALAAGQPSIVVAPGMVGLEVLPLVLLRPSGGVLRRAEVPEGAAHPLPPDFRPLAALALDAETGARLSAGLPAGVPLLIGADPLPALLACLAEALAARQGAERLCRAPPLQSAAPQSIAASDLLAEVAPSEADFQDLKLHQHNLSADGGYRHLDFSLIGLASAAGIWREARLKLFDRRGIIGLEFRNLKGWPRLFEAWPNGGSDHFGPVWRLETQAVTTAVMQLESPANRAVVAALLGVLPSAARQAAAVADLAEPEAWVARAQKLVASVATALEAEALDVGQKS